MSSYFLGYYLHKLDMKFTPEYTSNDFTMRYFLRENHSPVSLSIRNRNKKTAEQKITLFGSLHHISKSIIRLLLPYKQ